MPSYKSIIIALALPIILCAVSAGSAQADPFVPQAPATHSWLPHGYGQTMTVDATGTATLKGLHGFRTSPMHIGCWSQPLWGWDVNGYYQGPQVPKIDPGLSQLPIGLIYPSNDHLVPPPGPGLRKVGR